MTNTTKCFITDTTYIEKSDKLFHRQHKHQDLWLNRLDYFNIAMGYIS